MNHFDYKKTVFTVGVFDKVTSDDEFKNLYLIPSDGIKNVTGATPVKRIRKVIIMR